MAFNKETSMYEGFIYCLTNKINGKKYIGQTITTIKERFYQHIKTSKHGKWAISRAIRKYRKDNFIIKEIEKIEDCSKYNLRSRLNESEKYYIQKYKTLTTQYGYNMDIGGASCSYFSKPVSVFDKGIITRHLKNGANLHQTTPGRRYWGKLKAAVFARYGRSPLGAALFWLSRRPPADPGHSIRKV